MKYLLRSDNYENKKNALSNGQNGVIKNGKKHRISGPFSQDDHTQQLPGVFLELQSNINDRLFSYRRIVQCNNDEIKSQKVQQTNTWISFAKADEDLLSPTENTSVQTLNVSIRPSLNSEIPDSNFIMLNKPFSINEWRLLAAKRDAPLLMSSIINVYDSRLFKSTIKAPNASDKQYYIYIFNGVVEIDQNILNVGDLLVYHDENLLVRSQDTADLILFEIDPSISYIR